MNILIYSFNDKIGDGLQKITFIQKLKEIYPNSHITYTTTNTTTLKTILNPLVNNCIDEFIEHNNIQSSFLKLFKKNKIFDNKYYDLVIDLQKVVLRTLNLKRVSHSKFFSATANSLFSDFKNKRKYKFKGIYIEKFYFNILSIISGNEFKIIPDIKVPINKLSENIINSELDKNIAIAPGAGDKIRQWDFEKYLDIAIYLRERGFNIYFFLGPDERDYLDKCLENNFICPEWKDGVMISRDINFTMSLAKYMKCLLCNDGGTSWMFEFAGVKTLKIFGVTNEIKFARPEYSTTIQVNDYGIKNIKDFPLNEYKEKLNQFLNGI